MTTRQRQTHLRPGVPLALVSALLFGASAPFAKLMLGTSDAPLLAGFMDLGAGLGLALMHFGRGAVGLPAPEAPLDRADHPGLPACLARGVDSNQTRDLSSADPVVTAIDKGLVAGTVNAGLALSLGAAFSSLAAVGAAGLVGFLGVGLSLARTI